MKNGILNELITVMKERVPHGQNLASILADILCMGKEAVYRRLRGEVSFSIEEIAVISSKLGISIDQVVGSHNSNKVTFDLNLLHTSNAIESYYEILNRYQQIFEYVKDDSTTEIYTAANLLPFTLYSSYEYLSKFRALPMAIPTRAGQDSPFTVGHVCRKTDRAGTQETERKCQAIAENIFYMGCQHLPFFR